MKVPTDEWRIPGFEYRRWCEFRAYGAKRLPSYAKDYWIRIVVRNESMPMKLTREGDYISEVDKLESGALYLGGNSRRFPYDIIFVQNGQRLISSNLPEAKILFPEMPDEVKGNRDSLWLRVNDATKDGYIWVYYGNPWICEGDYFET